MFEVNSMILRVGRSSWELKIDPKRQDEEKKRVLEEDMDQRFCQESAKKLPKRSKVTIHWPCQHFRASRRTTILPRRGLRRVGLGLSRYEPGHDAPTLSTFQSLHGGAGPFQAEVGLGLRR